MSSLNRGGIGVVCESQKKGFSGGVEEKRNQAKKVRVEMELGGWRRYLFTALHGCLSRGI